MEDRRSIEQVKRLRKSDRLTFLGLSSKFSAIGFVGRNQVRQIARTETIEDIVGYNNC